MKHFLLPVCRVDAVHHQNRVLGGAFRLHQAADCPERFGVGLLWSGEHFPRRRLFNFLSVTKHFDPVRHLRDDREIMRDVNCSGVELLDCIPHRRENFDLRRHVERSGGFIEYDQIRSWRHCHRRHHALQLPARNLVRIALADRIRFRQLQRAVERAGIGLRLPLA